MIHVNLIPTARRLARESRRRVRLWAVGGGCWLVLLVGLSLWARMVWAHALDADLSSQLSAAKERLEIAKARNKVASTELKEIECELATARLAADRPDWRHLFALLSAHRGDDIQIEDLTLSGGLFAEEPESKTAAKPKKPPPAVLKEKYTLQLTGVARKPSEATDFVVRLESTKAFTRVALSETRARDVQGIAMTGFRIDCELVQQGGSPPPAAATQAAAPGDQP
jgi:hypothetical protein